MRTHTYHPERLINWEWKFELSLGDRPMLPYCILWKSAQDSHMKDLSQMKVSQTASCIWEMDLRRRSRRRNTDCTTHHTHRWQAEDTDSYLLAVDRELETKPRPLLCSLLEQRESKALHTRFGVRRVKVWRGQMWATWKKWMCVKGLKKTFALD